MKKIKIGNYITFKAIARWNNRKARRKVVSFYMGKPCVRFGGYSDFVVNLHEIEKVETC